MLTIERLAWPRLYADSLRKASEQGWARPSREGETIELGPATVSCKAPAFQVLEGRGGSTEFARIEQLGHLAGEGPSDLERLAPHFRRFAEADGSYPWAYGPRLADGLPQVVAELARRPFSRRAVAAIWGPEDSRTVASPMRTVNMPCALDLVFWTGPTGELRCHAMTRSCDLWFGFYYDMPTWAFLQRAVAKALRRPVGLTYQTATSFHLYTKHAAKAKDVRAVVTSEPVHLSLPDPPGNLDAVERFYFLKAWAMDSLAESRVTT